MCTVVTAVVIAMFYCPMLTGLFILLIPISGFLMTQSYDAVNISQKMGKGISVDTSIIQETILNMRTTKASNVIKKILKTVHVSLQDKGMRYRDILRSSLFFALSFSCSMLDLGCMYAIVGLTLQVTDATSENIMHSAIPLFYVLLAVGIASALLESAEAGYISA